MELASSVYLKVYEVGVDVMLDGPVLELADLVVQQLCLLLGPLSMRGHPNIFLCLAPIK